MQRPALWVLALFPCCVDAASLRRSKMTFIEVKPFKPSCLAPSLFGASQHFSAVVVGG